jgi:hypothetical protein
MESGDLETEKPETRQILCVVAWWSSDLQCWIASATTVQGVVGNGPSFSEAIKNLEGCLINAGYPSND